MAYTEDDRNAIERAIARGEHRVTFGDKTIEYRSINELKLVLREISAQLMRDDQISNKHYTRQIRVNTSKGL